MMICYNEAVSNNVKEFVYQMLNNLLYLQIPSRAIYTKQINGTWITKVYENAGNDMQSSLPDQTNPIGP